MRRRAGAGPLAVLIILAGAGCAGVHGTSPAPPPTPAIASKTGPAAAIAAPQPVAPEAPRYVLVRPGAFFHTAIPPAGRRAHEPFPTDGKTAALAAARFRLVEMVGDWVEVESIAADPRQPHCQPPSALFEGLALRLFVAAGDLQPLTLHRIHVAFHRDAHADALDLEPGVPVARHGEGWTAFPDGNPLAVELPADAVGAAYAPVLRQPIAAQETVLRPEVSIDVAAFKISVSGRRTDAPFEPSAGRDGHHAAYIQRSAPDGEGRLEIEVHTACAGYTGTVAATAVDRAQAPAPAAAWPPGKPGRARFTARPGATILWDDDRPAGRVLAEVPIAADANPDRQHPCFDWPLGPRGAAPESESTLRLCVAADDLVESPAFLSDQQVAVITARTRRQVALRIDNRTARSTPEIEDAIRTAARRRLFALGDLVMVPPAEDPATSASRALRNGLTQYMVKLSVEETIGLPGEMSSRRVVTELVRERHAAAHDDGTPERHVVKTGQVQQFQSAGGAVEEANALEEMLDASMIDVANALREER